MLSRRKQDTWLLQSANLWKEWRAVPMHDQYISVGDILAYAI